MNRCPGSVLALTLLALSGGGLGAAEEEKPAVERPLVVVELFTSQGCSSCPPADRLLSGLREEAGVLPLAFHVDYWNYIGWRDPFSSEAWSDRQRRYARALGNPQVYTPQMLFDGGNDCVGSKAAEVRERLAAARRQPPGGTLELTATVVDGAIEVALAAEVLRTGGGELHAVVVVFENGLETAVERGENARRKLHNDAVVRHLEAVATLPAKAGAQVQRTLTLRLDPGWDVRRLGLAAFLQDPDSMRIQGAAATALRART